MLPLLMLVFCADHVAADLMAPYDACAAAAMMLIIAAMLILPRAPVTLLHTRHCRHAMLRQRAMLMPLMLERRFFIFFFSFL